MVFGKLLGKSKGPEGEKNATVVSEKQKPMQEVFPKLQREYSIRSVGSDRPAGNHKFISYKLKGEYEQPWRDHPRLQRTKINNRIVYGFTILGAALAALICFMNVRSVKKYDYCLMYEDNFQTLDTNVWTHEVQIDGFGNGAFDWTTSDPKNSFVDAEGLHIVPTLTNETTDINNDLIYNGHSLNLTKNGGDGTCTGTSLSSCAIASNSTLGTMIPPVRSARLVTRGKKSIRYGKIEVVAKLPKGDWLWPAIWMMPENSTYGEWPKSGEIDIMESRGNTPGYSAGGRDVITSTLHWGKNLQSACSLTPAHNFARHGLRYRCILAYDCWEGSPKDRLLRKLPHVRDRMGRRSHRHLSRFQDRASAIHGLPERFQPLGSRQVPGPSKSPPALVAILG